MKCVVCKRADPVRESTTVILETGNSTSVLKGVPARVCGEGHVQEEVSARVFRFADDSSLSGAQIEIRQHAAV